jgi:hypothetical protein
VTAVSFSIYRGVGGFTMSDVTVGTNAPGGGDFEFRFNVLDTNSKNVNDLDLTMAIRAFIRWLETGGGSVGGNQITGITNQPSGPPN